MVLPPSIALRTVSIACCSPRARPRERVCKCCITALSFVNRSSGVDGGLSVFALAHPVVDRRASDTDQVASRADVLAVLDVVDEGTCALVVQERAPSGPAPRNSSRHGASLGCRLRGCRVLVAVGLQDHQRRSPGPHRWPGRHPCGSEVTADDVRSSLDEAAWVVFAALLAAPVGLTTG